MKREKEKKMTKKEYEEDLLKSIKQSEKEFREGKGKLLKSLKDLR